MAASLGDPGDRVMSVVRDDALGRRFSSLDCWLLAHRFLWHPRPFAAVDVPWRAEHPDVAGWLSSLDDAAIDAIDAGADGFGARSMLPAAMLGWVEGSEDVASVGAWPGDGRAEAGLQDERLRWRVKGRKWQQVARFAACVLPSAVGAGRVVDWCGGKGHLGRTLGALGAGPATVLEVDGRLREPALALAERARAMVVFEEGDALTSAAVELLGTDAFAVALHACGGLTNALIRAAMARGVPDIALAPCCYHLAHPDGGGCVPLSVAGSAAGLRLDHSTLRLATAEEVVASPSERRGRRRESAWRLGLDLLLREASGEDRYRALGTIEHDVLRLSFAEFCSAVASSRGLELPRRWSADRAQSAGEERARLARALGLVRAVFRRPLELWLVLDRALALQEGGYAVGVGEFCSKAVTPRNLLIRGEGGLWGKGVPNGEGVWGGCLTGRVSREGVWNKY